MFSLKNYLFHTNTYVYYIIHLYSAMQILFTCRIQNDKKTKIQSILVNRATSYRVNIYKKKKKDRVTHSIASCFA